MKRIFRLSLIVVICMLVAAPISMAASVSNPWTDGDAPSNTEIRRQYADFDYLKIYTLGTLYGATPLSFEGASYDAYQTTLGVEDPTADHAVTLPNATGVTILSTAVPGAAGSISGVANGLVAEGATADAYETTISITDPTADNTVTIADGSGTVMLSSLSTNAPDAANSVWGASNGLKFEGASADDYETTVSPDDPTADRTLTIPDYSGSVPIVVQQGYTQFSHSEATTVDVTGAALTLADGWFTEGKTFRVKAGGTVTGTNGVVTVALYLEDGAVCTLTTGSAAAGDWTAEFIIIATGTATQRIIGTLVAGAGSDPISDYATDTTDISSDGTIPLKLQVGLANASDAITCEFWSIEYWNKAD